MNYAELSPQQELLYLEHAAEAADGAEEQLRERMAEAKDRSDLRRLGVAREVMDLVVDDMTTAAEDWANIGEGSGYQAFVSDIEEELPYQELQYEGDYLMDRLEDSCAETPALHKAFISQARQLCTIRILLARTFQDPEPPAIT